MRIHTALHHADAFDASRHNRLNTLLRDGMGGHRDRLQTGSAKAIHRDPGYRYRQASQHRSPPRNIQPLGSMRLCTAQNHILDLRRIERRGLPQHVPNAVRGQILRPGHIERATK